MRFLTLFRGMMKRDLIEMRRYAFNTFSQIITIYVIFVLIFFGAKSFVGARVGAGSTLSAIVVGFMTWTLAIATYSDTAIMITTEAQAGTLEQLAMSPSGLGTVMIARFLTTFILGSGIMFVLLFLMMATTGHWLHIDLGSVIPLVFLIAVGVQGVGFVMGGLALVFKRIQSFTQIMQFAFVALVAVPVATVTYLKFLPLAWGNELLRRSMIDGRALSSFAVHDIVFLLANSILWLAAGMIVFRKMIDVARDRALLGQY